jgi:hypothetical protein
MDYYKNLSEQTRKRILQLAEEVRGVVPIKEKTFRISTGQLDPRIEPSYLLDQATKWMIPKHPYIYYFQALNNPALDIIEQTFKKAKERQKNKRAYPRFNRRSDVIYVGCSWGMLLRFKSHLGYGARSTFSLQLAHWAQKLNLELDLVCAEYPQNIPPKALQLLEDTLWDTLKPMFGRRGPK